MKGRDEVEVAVEHVEGPAPLAGVRILFRPGLVLADGETLEITIGPRPEEAS